jgi:S-adenosylmethionine synthetase
MIVSVEALEGQAAGDRAVEVVERKGIGHPDTICDALAEELSLALSHWYVEHGGRILHHNVDKVLLRGGAARPAFGGGEVTQPIEIHLSGRATAAVAGKIVPIDELAQHATRQWLVANIPALDPDRHVRLHTQVRSGSAALTGLFARGASSPAEDRNRHGAGTALANDTSIGVGYAPPSALETLVLDIERTLRAPEFRRANPAIGDDLKVLAIRTGHAVGLTVACAMIDRFLPSMAAYREACRIVLVTVRALAAARFGDDVDVVVNAADGNTPESVYLTVTGTSAEAGDDGEAGRGNRANGLITPSRPMTMESIAGKNPVSHVGKLYNLVAFLIADDIVRALPHVREAECLLASRIGHPIDDPAVLHLRLRTDAATLGVVRDDAEAVARRRLATVGRLHEELLARRLVFDTWPLERESTFSAGPRS